MAGRLVNHKELATLLDVSQSTITGWHRNYGLPMAERGSRGKTHTYDISAVFRWFGAWEVDKVVAAGVDRGGKIVDIKAEEARLKMHQADKAEVDAQKAKGEVLLIEEVKDTLNTIATTYGSQLDALGGRLANELASIDNPAEIREKLFAEGRRIRETTADALTTLVASANTGLIEIGESPTSANG